MFSRSAGGTRTFISRCNILCTCVYVAEFEYVRVLYCFAFFRFVWSCVFCSPRERAAEDAHWPSLPSAPVPCILIPSSLPIQQLQLREFQHWESRLHESQLPWWCWAFLSIGLLFKRCRSGARCERLLTAAFDFFVGQMEFAATLHLLVARRFCSGLAFLISDAVMESNSFSGQDHHHQT